jgi:hypothetical protein
MLVLMACVAVLASPFLPLLHDATVEHVVCADHGELLDAAANAGGDASEPRDDQEKNPGQHCEFGLRIAAKTVVSTAAVLAISLDCTNSEWLLPAVAHGLLAESVLEYAPKNSPPLT